MDAVREDKNRVGSDGRLHEHRVLAGTAVVARVAAGAVVVAEAVGEAGGCVVALVAGGRDVEREQVHVAILELALEVVAGLLEHARRLGRVRDQLGVDAGRRWSAA